MPTASSSFMVEETGVCVLLTLHHRTIIVSMEVETLATSLPNEEPSNFVVWALTVPRRERRFADGFYTVTAPVPLGCISYASVQERQPHKPHPRTAVLSLGRWEVFAGTHVALVLAPPGSPVCAVRNTLEEAVRTKRSLLELMDKAEPQTLPFMHAAHWRLCGSQVATSSGRAADEVEWQPLLHRRWYELKSYVRQGTEVPYWPSAHRTRRVYKTTSDSEEGAQKDGQEKMPSQQQMFAGDVREADAISINRQCVLWTDGGVGLHDEVKPFYRVYQPARQEKTIRVRRFPHRYADVIGEIPFGQCVEAFGRATDPFTQEQYVLLYLPAGEAFAPHIATYDLTFVAEGRYVWGWSKLAGCSGLPLLMERQVDETAATEMGSAFPALTTRANAQGAGGKTDVMQLPEGVFYTPVREGRAVRIRKRPTLMAATLREMEANEVRAARALLTVPIRPPSDSSGTAVPHVFVHWQQGGYSLLRNEVECFLQPVMLSRVPRRFPIRTRSRSGASDGEAAVEEVIDLSQQRSRKRQRHAVPPKEDDTDAELEDMLYTRSRPAAAAATLNDSLLSPYSLPASLQEGLRKGVVRLEDLPPLLQPSEKGEQEKDEVEETDGTDSSSFEV